jgi:hypothetical protein
LTALAEHESFRSESRQDYLDNRNAQSDALDWRQALWEARRSTIRFFRASNYLFDVAGALQVSGYHSFPLRHLLAPPVSQDQFKLLCPDWFKSSEKSGKGLPPLASLAVATTFAERRSKHLTAWVDRGRGPLLRELSNAIGAVAPLMANQRLATARRNRLAALQETAVLDLLESRGWIRLQSGPVMAGGQLPARHFMHKTRFASGPAQTQEVDVACGLGATVILALECKVTNDETNSVKRINDVLKKAHAWKDHWGAFVKPAALLQGVIKPSEVTRLVDGGVEVFWSHRLDLLGDWIDANEI